MKETNATVGFISLGCPKALVDSERILTQLRSEGYGLTNHYQDADLVVVNTCGFIDAAVEESLQAIGEALDENGKVIVTGCLGAQSDKVLDKYPNVLGISGPHAYEEVMSSVHENLPAPHEPWNSLIPAEGLKLTPRHYAYLKISEGCNHRCTFCIIPHLRGDLVSRPIGEVMQEAENLANAGVKELLVVSQDTSAYGLDLRYRTDFWNGRPLRTNIHQLAKSLGELDIWIRMHYVYPYPHVDDLIPLMAEGTILPYLDIPLQHGSERVLRAMKRPAATEKVLNRIAHWRDICPDITLRSTFIVGFPGETQAEFDELLDFIREGRLDRVGCFMYSPVDGAPANDLSGEVPEEVKEERFEQFMAVQAEISAERLSEKIGQTIQVLVDEVDEEGVIARGPGDAPEIDGMIYLPQMEGVQPGDFLKVQVTHADEHDLWAQPAE